MSNTGREMDLLAGLKGAPPAHLPKREFRLTRLTAVHVARLNADKRNGPGRRFEWAGSGPRS